MEKNFLKKGENVSLRDAHPYEVKTYIRWMKEGEWREFDAPWEESDCSEKDLKKRFNRLFLEEKTEPRKRAIITVQKDTPIGWVNRYSEGDHNSVFLVGIDICEDDHLGEGLGTEALSLWIDYLFQNSEVHKIGLNTYNFNKRMNTVANKLGFKREGVDREIVHWNGSWRSRIRYGILRREWKERDDPSLR